MVGTVLNTVYCCVNTLGTILCNPHCSSAIASRPTSVSLLDYFCPTHFLLIQNLLLSSILLPAEQLLTFGILPQYSIPLPQGARPINDFVFLETFAL